MESVIYTYSSYGSSIREWAERERGKKSIGGSCTETERSSGKDTPQELIDQVVPRRDE